MARQNFHGHVNVGVNFIEHELEEQEKYLESLLKIYFVYLLQPG